MQLLVAGTTVRLEGTSPAELADLRAALAEGLAADGPAQLVLRSERGSVPHPGRRPDRVVQHVRYWDQGDDQIVATGPGQRARVSRARALLDPGDGGVRAVHQLLLPVLTLLFASQDACLIHGAAFLAGPDAVLVLGGSGQGKSTLVTAALSLGRGVLSDDLLVLRLHGDGVQVSGVPQPLALPADQAYHPAVGHRIDGDPRGRHAAAGQPPLTPGTHPVAAVVLVEHSQLPGGQLRPAEGRAVFGGLLASTLEGLAPGTARHAFPYAAAVSRANGWHLGHAADPAIRVQSAAGRLDQISRGQAPAG